MYLQLLWFLQINCIVPSLLQTPLALLERVSIHSRWISSSQGDTHRTGAVGPIGTAQRFGCQDLEWRQWRPSIFESFDSLKLFCSVLLFGAYRFWSTYNSMPQQTSNLRGISQQSCTHYLCPASCCFYKNPVGNCSLGKWQEIQEMKGNFCSS